MLIRAGDEADQAGGVHSVIESAFETPAESYLVDSLKIRAIFEAITRSGIFIRHIKLRKLGNGGPE